MFEYESLSESTPLFLSYSVADVEFALRLAVDLKNAGVYVWMDRLDAPSDRWAEAIAQAHEQSAALLPILSPSYAETRYCQDELILFQQADKPVLPLLLATLPEGEWQPPDGEHVIDFTQWQDPDCYAQQLYALIDLLGETAREQVWRPADAEADTITTLLGKLQTPDALLGQLESALNQQGAFKDAPRRPQPAFEQTDQLAALCVEIPASASIASSVNAVIGLDQAVAQYPRLVIAAPDGTGKSYALRSLVLDAVRKFVAAPGSAPLPLLVDLANWDESASLSDVISGAWTLESEPMALLADGQITLYLDGLSELPHTTAFSQQIDALRGWLSGENAPQRVVLTCETTDLDRIKALDLPVVTLPALDADGIETTIRQHLDAESADAILAQLNGEAISVTTIASRQIARNPFLLNALLLRYNSGEHDFPASAGTLLQWVVSVLWTAYATENDGTTPTFDAVETALSGFAYALVEADSPTTVSREDALRQIDSADLLDAAVGAHLLRVQDDHVRFSSGLLQNYFAALALNRLEITRRLSKPQFDAALQRRPKRWDDVICMLVGLVDDPNTLIFTIASVDPFLALEAVFSSANVDEATCEAMLQQVLQPNNIDSDNRVKVANVLAKFAPAQARDLLIEAARDAAWNVRVSAANALRQLSYTPQAIPATGVAQTAEQTDNTLSDEAQTNLLTETDPSAAREAFGVWLHLLNTTQRPLKHEALKALGNLKDSAAVPYLIEMMDSPDRALATEAMAALGNIGDPVAVPKLVDALAHADWRISKTAAKALVKLGDVAFPALSEIVETGTNSRRQRILSIEILAKIGTPEAEAWVLEATHSDDVEERFAAVAALQHLNDDATYQRLIECLEDIDQPDWSMQRICDVAANILENMGSGEASKAVKLWRLSQLKNLRIGKKISSSIPSGKTVKERLMRVLNASPVAAEDAPALLPPSSGEFDWMTRRETAASLASAPAEIAIPQLLTFINDDESQVRVAAITSLANFKDDERVLPALLQALRDSEYLVSDAAGTTLKGLGICPIPGLLYAVRSPDLNVRATAIDVAGAIGQQDAVPALIEALSDLRKLYLSTQRVCDVAAEALQKIATPEALEALTKWRKEQKTPLQESVDKFKGQSADAADSESTSAENLVVLSDLIDALHSEDWSERQEAAKTLRDYGKMMRGKSNPAVIERISALLDDADFGIRFAATEALAWIKDTTAVPKLIEHVSDDRWAVRASSIRALREIGDESALPSIRTAVSDERADVRESAVEALGSMRDTGAIGVLSKALTDPEEFVRLAAIEALGNIKDAAAVLPLHNLLNEADPSLRWSITDALRKIAHPDAIPDLVPMLDDTSCPHWEDKRICDVAASALAAIDTAEARTALEAWKQGPPNH